MPSFYSSRSVKHDFQKTRMPVVLGSEPGCQRGEFLTNFCASRKVGAYGKIGAMAMLDFGSFGTYAPT
jgi:hypothetical protein